VVTQKPAVERRRPPRTLVRLFNPLMRRLIARGLAAEQMLALHYVGRKTGRRFDVPAGYHMIDGVPTVLTDSPWRHNFAGGGDLHVTLRGRRRAARALLVDDPEQGAAAYERLIGVFGRKRATRRLGLRFNVDREPTREELRQAVRRNGLCLVRIEPTDA
jgi:hypothetical protein